MKMEATVTNSAVPSMLTEERGGLQTLYYRHLVLSTCGSDGEDKLADPTIDPRLLQALEVDGESSCSGIMSVMAR